MAKQFRALPASAQIARLQARADELAQKQELKDVTDLLRNNPTVVPKLRKYIQNVLGHEMLNSPASSSVAGDSPAVRPESVPLSIFR